MIETINIKNFRGIKELSIDKLSRINLILGNNNCGKTSVLDSLFLFSGATNPRLSVIINWARQYGKISDELFRLNFYGMNPSEDIVFSGRYNNGKKRNLTISYNEESSETITEVNAGNQEKHYFLNLQADISGKIYETSMRYPGKTDSEASISSLKDEEYEEELRSLYISSSDPYNNNVKLFSDLLLDKQERALIESLRHIEPNLKDIIVANDNLYADVSLDKRIPIQVLGDGIRKIISILINMYQARNGGILLIDEIDNGLHYKSMPTLWKSILTMAHKYDVQIFATTHNIDSIQALNNTLGEADYENMQQQTHIYTLRKNSSGLMKAFMNEYSQFNHLIKTETEIR